MSCSIVSPLVAPFELLPHNLVNADRTREETTHLHLKARRSWTETDVSPPLLLSLKTGRGAEIASSEELLKLPAGSQFNSVQWGPTQGWEAWAKPVHNKSHGAATSAVLRPEPTGGYEGPGLVSVPRKTWPLLQTGWRTWIQPIVTGENTGPGGSHTLYIPPTTTSSFNNIYFVYCRQQLHCRRN